MRHMWNRRKIVKCWAYGQIQGDLVADTVKGAVEGEVRINVGLILVSTYIHGYIIPFLVQI